jgi:DNA-binding transcriptional regulator GbsR (MarR family)
MPLVDEEKLNCSRTRMEFVDLCGSAAQGFGFPRSIGEIYGFLYLSANPVSAQHLVDELALSKASVSTGTRQLLALGFVRKVWKRDQRRDYFEAEIEIWGLMSMAYERVIKIRAHEAKRQLSMVQETLGAERDIMSNEEYALMKERLDNLEKFKSRAKKFMPIIEKLIK